MARFIQKIIENEKIPFDTQIELCEKYILTLSKEQINECCIKMTYKCGLTQLTRTLSLLTYLTMNKKYFRLLTFLLKNKEKDIDFEVKDSKDELTALMYAAHYSGTYSSEEIIQTLIDAGANVNQQGIYGFTPLMFAASNFKKMSSENTLHILLKAGADINIKNKFGKTVIDSVKNHEIKQLLNETIAKQKNKQQQELVVQEQELITREQELNVREQEFNVREQELIKRKQQLSELITNLYDLLNKI